MVGTVANTVQITMDSTTLAPGLRYLFDFKNSMNAHTKIAAPYNQPIYYFALPPSTYDLTLSFAAQNATTPTPGWAQAQKFGIVVPATAVKTDPKKGTVCAGPNTGAGITP